MQVCYGILNYYCYNKKEVLNPLGSYNTAWYFEKYPCISTFIPFSELIWKDS